MQDIPKDISYPKDALFIQDGNALFHMLENLPPTYSEICLIIPAPHDIQEALTVITQILFKAQERLKHGSSEKIILGGPATKKPYDFNSR